MNTKRNQAKLIQEIVLLVVIIIIIIATTLFSTGKKLNANTKTPPTPHINTEFDTGALDVIHAKEDNYVRVDSNGVGKADPFSS